MLFNGHHTSAKSVSAVIGRQPRYFETRAWCFLRAVQMTTDHENEKGIFECASESLKMLESEEGQLNAVFACFGSAAQHAQLFEQGLAEFLIAYNRICSDSIAIDDLEAGTSSLRRRTMGQLLRKLSEHVTIEEISVSDCFSTALKSRNYLMHEFFLKKNSELETAEGRMQLLVELTTIQGILERSRVMINAMRIAMCETLGVEDDAKQ